MGKGHLWSTWYSGNEEQKLGHGEGTAWGAWWRGEQEPWGRRIEAGRRVEIGNQIMGASITLMGALTILDPQLYRHLSLHIGIPPSTPAFISTLPLVGNLPLTGAARISKVRHIRCSRCGGNMKGACGDSLHVAHEGPIFHNCRTRFVRKPWEAE